MTFLATTAVLLAALPLDRGGPGARLCKWRVEGLPRGAEKRFRAAALDGIRGAVGQGNVRGCVDVAVEGLGGTFLFSVKVGPPLGQGPVTSANGKCEVCTVTGAVRRLEALVRSTVVRAIGAKSAARPTRPVHPLRKAPQPPEGGVTGPSAPAKRPGAEARAARPGTAARVYSEKGGAGTTGRVVVKKRRLTAAASALKLSGWILGGVSVAALGSGAVLLALHGRGSCAGSGECEDVYKTRVPGAVALSLGGAGLAAAIALWVIGAKKARKAGSDRTAARSTDLFPDFVVTVGGNSRSAQVTVWARF